MKRLVVIADNPLIVGAIRAGTRESETLHLLGYLDARKATPATILSAGADVVLVNEADQSEEAIGLIRGLKEQDQDVAVIVLSVEMQGAWVGRAFEAGANGAISKSIQPNALATLVREALSGHIVHSPTHVGLVAGAGGAGGRHVPADDHCSLTERELEVLRLVASGATNGEIARQLWITQQTVKFHVSNVYRKLDVANRTEACHYAHVNGLLASDGAPAAAPVPQRALVAVA